MRRNDPVWKSFKLNFLPNSNRSNDTQDGSDSSNERVSRVSSLSPSFSSVRIDTIKLINQLLRNSKERLDSRVETRYVGYRQLWSTMNSLMVEEDKRRIEEFTEPPISWTKIPPVTEIDIPSMTHYLHVSFVAYEKSEKLRKESLSMLGYRIMHCRKLAEKFIPSYFIAYSFQRRSLVVSVRGTHATADIFTDLSVETEKFYGTLAHRGVVLAAKNILKETEGKLFEHLQVFKTEEIIVTGHSLGASTSAVIAILLHKTSKLSKIARVSSIGFCPVPIFKDPSIAALFDYVTVVTHNNDLFSHMSLASIERLQYRIAIIAKRNIRNKKYPNGNGEEVDEYLDQEEVDYDVQQEMENAEISAQTLSKELGVHEIDLYLPGKIWHICRDPKEDKLGTPRIIRRDAVEYLDIIPSKSMIEDHNPRDMLEILDYLTEQQYK